MTDATPDRQIVGLSPRRPGPDVSRLVRKSREQRPASEVETARREPLAAALPTSDLNISDYSGEARAGSTAAAAESVAQKDALAPVDSTRAKPNRVQQTIYMEPGNRDRAKAAFLQTNHLEGGLSWSEFVENAVLAEVQRRERQYNGGVPFAPDAQKLRPGRRPTL